MEAKYMAASDATSEIVWLCALLTELGIKQTEPTVLYTDSQSAIAAANREVPHARTKHIDIHYHFVRERIASHEVMVNHCTSEENAADLFTKAFPRPRHEDLVARLGLRTESRGSVE